MLVLQHIWHSPFWKIIKYCKFFGENEEWALFFISVVPLCVFGQKVLEKASCHVYWNLTNRKFKALHDPRVHMVCASLSSQLCWLFEAFDNEKELLYKTLAVQFQCNERVTVPPRLDALTEQISAAAHTIYSKCYTTHMQEKIGWWTRDAGIKSNTYILTILGTNDVCVCKQTNL